MKLRLNLINVFLTLTVLMGFPGLAWLNLTTSRCRMSAAEQAELILHYRNCLSRFRAMEARADVEPEQRTLVSENATRVENEIAHLENQK